MVYEPKDNDSLVQAIEEAESGDTVLIPVGKWIWPRIITKTGITLKGVESGDSFTSMLLPQKGFGIKAYNCHFENFTMVSDGGQAISLDGDNNVCTNVNFYGGDRALGVSGQGNVVDGGLFAYCTGNGIDVNGGFIYLPEISNKPLNLQIALRNKDKYTASQYSLIEKAYYDRDMNLTISNAVGYRNGYAGGTFTGGFIKLVPGAGGVTIEDCQDYFSTNSYWFDFPSTTDFSINRCLSVGAIVNGIFLEGSRRVGDAKGYIRGCSVIGAKVGLFVSAFPDAIVTNTVLAATETPLKAHGIKQNDKGNRLYTYVSNGDGDNANTLISMNPDTYRAHTVTWSPIGYNRSFDKRYNLYPLPLGASYIDTLDDNISQPISPETSTYEPNLSNLVNLPTIPNLDSVLRTSFTKEVEEVYGQVKWGGPFSHMDPIDTGSPSTPLTLEQRVDSLEQRVDDLEK